MNIHH